MKIDINGGRTFSSAADQLKLGQSLSNHNDHFYQSNQLDGGVWNSHSSFQKHLATNMIKKLYIHRNSFLMTILGNTELCRSFTWVEFLVSMIGSMSYYVHTFSSLNHNASNHTLLINTVYIVDTENRIVGCVQAQAREGSFEYLETLQWQCM